MKTFSVRRSNDVKNGSEKMLIVFLLLKSESELKFGKFQNQKSYKMGSFKAKSAVFSI